MVYGNGNGAQWQWAIGVSFTVNSQAIETITVDDRDVAPGNAAFDNSGADHCDQVAPPSTNSDLIPVGARIENEYEVTLTDGDNEFRLVAISNGMKIIGYTFDGPWPPADVQLTVVPNS